MNAGSEFKPATAREFMFPNQAKREPITRQTAATILVTLPAMFGAIVLGTLGGDQQFLIWVWATVLGLGALGGWIHHPVRRLRWKGAACGILVASGALGLSVWYMASRGGFRNINPKELLLPVLGGTVPGTLLYLAWLRDERVAPWELDSGNRSFLP